MKSSIIKKLLSFVLALTMLLGTLPTISYAATTEEGDIVNVTNGKTFTLKREYYEVLTSHPSYGTKDYIAYPWQGYLVIWFFNDDLSNVKFSMWNRGTYNFGLYPSENVSFTQYVYSLENLELASSGDGQIATSNAYNYSYEFIASFDIYTDKTYSTYFYEVEGSEPIDPEPPKEEEDIVNVTNGKTFTLKREYYEVLTSNPSYGTKDYIAYPWQGYLVIWFFNDDLSNVKFSMWNRGTYNFGLYPSENVSFTQYVYSLENLELASSGDGQIATSNAYNYSYEFMASFDIYTDKTYSTYFYETKNSSGNVDEPIVKFEPLEPNEAKEFLKYVSNAGTLVNIEEKLPDYYNFLVGEIQDPNEELKVKLSFLTYLYYCLDVQLAQTNERIGMGATYLIKWIEEHTEASSIIYSEIQNAIVDSLKATIAANATLPVMQIAGLNIVTAIIEYGDLFVVSVGSISEIRTRDEILYLLAYKKLLEAKAANDEIDIALAESECEWISNNVVFGGDFNKMQRFAGYLFNIEQSLPM